MRGDCAALAGTRWCLNQQSDGVIGVPSLQRPRSGEPLPIPLIVWRRVNATGDATYRAQEPVVVQAGH